MSKSSTATPTSSKFPVDVISGAQAIQEKYGVPASVTLAQWAVESAYGRSTPPSSNNPFGIKAKSGEPYVTAWTSEYVNGKKVNVQARFRKFDSYAEAFDARGLLLSSASLYAGAMKHKAEPDRFAEEIHKAGYATDPDYSGKLKAIMKSFNLYQFDITAKGGGTPMSVKNTALKAVSARPTIFLNKTPQPCVVCPTVSNMYLQSAAVGVSPITAVGSVNPSVQSRMSALVSSENEAKLARLHPAVRTRAEQFLTKAKEAGFDLRITEGFRSVEKQNELYAQGRTKPGKIVTWAKGGASFHNYGLAFDIYDKKKGYDVDWNKLAGIGKEAGLEWGGDWGGMKRDKPHFQYTGGLTLQEVQQGKRPSE